MIMAKGTPIKPENFSKCLSDTLKAYGDDVASVTFEIVEETAKNGATKLKTTNWGFAKRSGNYQRSFRVALRKTRLAVTATIFSQAPHYRLTHLLEYGHDVIRNGVKVGETKSYPHWSKVEDMAISELEERLTRGLMDL